MHFQKSFKVYKKVSESKEILKTCEDNVQYHNELSRKTPNSIHRFVL